MKMRFGPSDVVATVLEYRGPLGMGGRHLVRVKFFLEGTANPAETEVPVEELTVVALPNDPAEKRIAVEAVGDEWVGTYTAPDGRVAVITEEMRKAEQATHAALRWVRVGLSERTERPTVHGREMAYIWKPHPRHPRPVRRLSPGPAWRRDRSRRGENCVARADTEGVRVVSVRVRL